ncbi:MAG: ornithine carbamoyltransferase [Arenicella sp.]
MSKSVRHFLTLSDFTGAELQQLIDRGIELKHLRNSGQEHTPLKHKTLAMLFEKSSTRTRVSFETGMIQLGGSSLFLSPDSTQIGRGEPIEDTARVISSMVDGIMIRTDAHEKITTFAEHSSVPVINALTDDYHPCQLLADIMTFQENRGSIQGAKIAWVGDGNNMCHSWMNAAQLFDFQLHIATPKAFLPNAQLLTARDSHIHLFDSPQEAVTQCDVVVTDTWASMGQENEKAARETAFTGYCVDTAMMALANKDAMFMHCLPAYRESEVSTDVIDGPQSVVWQEAENRLHAQKALLEKLLS